MKISIITACLNVEDTIEKTFLSVLNQTYIDWEIVVIDGVSTDGTLEIIEQYKENISYFVSEPDTGIYNAMNKGIKASNGDFILFLNANDTLHSIDILEKVANTLIENPEVKYLFGDVNYISEDCNKGEVQKYNQVKNDIFFVNQNICHQSIFYHKSLFAQLGNYSEDYKVYADWEFNIKCLVQNKTAAIYLPLTISDFQLGGLSANKSFSKLYKKEKAMVAKRNFKKYFVLAQINTFLQKTFGSLYKPLIRSEIFIGLIKNYASRKKFRLNLK